MPFSRKGSRMRTTLIALTTLAMACGGPPEETTDIEEGLDLHEQELASDAWQYIFAVRSSGASGFVANPVGASARVTCADGVVRAECTISRLNFGASGLNATSQQSLLTRIASEPAAESSISVLLKGTFVRVRDHRTTPATIYDELRVSAAYRAPTVRSHAEQQLYVLPGTFEGYRAVRSTNTELISHAINIGLYGTFRWVGPSPERPSSYPSDGFVSVVRAVLLDPEGSALGPFRFEVDQRFTRVTN